MVVSEIRDIKIMDSHIYYRQIFEATAIYTFFGQQKAGKIKFSVEHTPTGETIIQVILIDSVEYPILQLMIDLKAKIRDLITEEKLPMP